MYISKYFTLPELAHPKIIKDLGTENVWRRLNEFALMDLDYIRETWHLEHKTGIYINRLTLGLDSRGLRPPNDKDGATYSGHKKGDTFDLEPVNGKHLQLYRHVHRLISNDKLQLFNTLEDFAFTKTWVHVGYLNTDKKPLIVRP